MTLNIDLAEDKEIERVRPSVSRPPLNIRPAAALLGPVLACAVLPGAAHADDAGDDHDQIVVNGERVGAINPNADPLAPYKVDRSADSKFTELLRDTPRSVTVIPKEVLQDIGATAFRDVARSTPGVTLGTGEGGNAFGDRIFIRGFEARNDVYIDGMRDPGVSSRETFDIEQIEIVKGPSSAFGGRGTTGGMVSLQSKKAQLRDFNVLEAGLGTDAFRRVTLDANRKLADNLALRVNAMWSDADTPGRDYVWQRRWGAAAALLWQPAPNLTVDADFYHYQFTGMSDYGLPFDITTQQPFAVDPDNFYGAVGRDFLRGAAKVGTLTLRYDAGDHLSLRSMTRYGTVSNRYVVSVPRAPDTSAADPANWTESPGVTQRNAITREIDTLADATFRFDTLGVSSTLVAGWEYANERVTNRRFAFPDYVEDANGNPVTTSALPPLNLFDPDPVLGYAIPALDDLATPPAVTMVETMSVYAINTFKFSPQWEATGGVRYDSYAIRSYGTSRGTPYDRSQTVGFANWQASLTYKPIEAATIYASVSTSSNPSGEQLDSTSDVYGGLGAGSADLTPERNRAYEFGAKYETAGGHLLLNAAVFRIDKENAREQTAPNVYELVGKLRSQGVELGASGNITSRLAVFGGYTFLDAKIIASSIPANVGQRFANIPRHSGSMLVTYALTDKLTLGGQATYRSEIFGGTYQAQSAKVPGYWRFDAVGRYRFSDEVELRVNVTNLTDKRYFDAIYRSSAPFAYIAPGRAATFTLTAKF